jgi:hypothetical protein
VVVSANVIRNGALEPFYEVKEDAQRGKMPGAIITLNPYVGAAKFVLSGRDVKKGITETASRAPLIITFRMQ